MSNIISPQSAQLRTEKQNSRSYFSYERVGKKTNDIKEHPKMSGCGAWCSRFPALTRPQKHTSLRVTQRFKRAAMDPFGVVLRRHCFHRATSFCLFWGFLVRVFASYLSTRREETRSSTGTSPQTRLASASSPSLPSAPKPPELFSKCRARLVENSVYFPSPPSRSLACRCH